MYRQRFTFTKCNAKFASVQESEISTVVLQTLHQRQLNVMHGFTLKSDSKNGTFFLTDLLLLELELNLQILVTKIYLLLYVPVKLRETQGSCWIFLLFMQLQHYVPIACTF